uniref:Transmembrane protein 100 n=1 Tax=Nothobranchius furzeri TaxID=105023 RepID=A0A8C6KI09_NOTFU
VKSSPLPLSMLPPPPLLFDVIQKQPITVLGLPSFSSLSPPLLLVRYIYISWHHNVPTKVPEVLSSLERLSQATGGMEKSWYRCIFPFGIISLVIGVAGTGVTYTYDDLPQIKVVAVVLLITGLVLLMTATACWSLHKKKRRKKKERESLTSEQCPL